MAKLLRRCSAEFLGTFAYVFFGCGTKILVGDNTDIPGRLLVYFVFGFTLVSVTFALSHISAAPFNPAITLGLAVARRFPWRYVLPYWLAQVLGAVAASACHLYFLSTRAATTSYGATIPGPGIGSVQAVCIEAIMSFFLMLVAMAASTDRRVNRVSVGIAIGLVIIIAGFFASSLTGGSLNPARSLAPALFAGGLALTMVWIYWIGPCMGAVLGALVYEAMRGGEEHALEAPEGIFEDIKRHRSREV